MYLLDTNICIYLINRRSPQIINKIERCNLSDIKISSISIAEMEYGASKSKNPEKNRDALKRFLSPFEIISFDLQDAAMYGIIRAALERNGNTIGPYDMQLAEQALRRNYIFVTNNSKEFQRIPQLKLENWI